MTSNFKDSVEGFDLDSFAHTTNEPEPVQTTKNEPETKPKIKSNAKTKTKPSSVRGVETKVVTVPVPLKLYKAMRKQAFKADISLAELVRNTMANDLGVNNG